MSTMNELQMPAAVRPIDLYAFFKEEINKVDAPLDTIEEEEEEDTDDVRIPAAQSRTEADQRPEAGPSASEAAREEGRTLLRRWTTA